MSSHGLSDVELTLNAGPDCSGRPALAAERRLFADEQTWAVPLISVSLC